MATDAPNTGARSRAPRNPAAAVPTTNTIDEMIEKARAICVAADAIDAMTLGVEVMIENQRRLMRHENAGSFLLDNELWGGMATLLTMVRTQALDVATDGQAIEVAGMQAPKAPATA